MELHTEKLKAVRKRKKITAGELAGKMGISRMTLGAWENGKRIPSEAKIRMLAKVLEIPADEISDLTPDKTVSDIDLASFASSIRSVLSGYKKKNLPRQTDLIADIMGVMKELSDARLIIGAMISSLPSIFYIKGTDLKYIAVSEAFLKNLSLNKDYDVIGKNDFDFFPENEAKINDEMDRKVMSDGKSILNIEGYIPGNRKAKWGIMSKIPVLDAEGKIEGLVGCFVDITEHKKAEAKYNRIVNLSPNPVCVLGTDGCFKFVNPAWEKVLGHTREALLAKPLLSMIHPDDHARINAEMARLAEGELSLDFECRHLHRDGSTRCFRWTATSIPQEKLIYCIAADTTGRRQIEESLRVHQTELEIQNEELRRIQTELEAGRVRYFELYDLAPVGFCTLSEKGLILEANIAAATLFGVLREKLIKRPFTGFVLPEDQDSCCLKRKALAATSLEQNWNMRMQRADGSSFWAHIQAKPMRNGECMIALHDLSGRKELESTTLVRT
ncbi:MAG: aerobic respiration control sensor protein ArcB [Lentisphaerae bacterium ADurb.Bin242]|nr:MAG: aerobic respiration control sensor protein ArcB [Lentisphaerae bacterium ADurb.Bin242]